MAEIYLPAIKRGFGVRLVDPIEFAPRVQLIVDEEVLEDAFDLRNAIGDHSASTRLGSVVVLYHRHEKRRLDFAVLELGGRLG